MCLQLKSLKYLAIACSREVFNLFLQAKYHTVNIPNLDETLKGC
jgi:hypothetical protein